MRIVGKAIAAALLLAVPAAPVLAAGAAPAKSKKAKGKKAAAKPAEPPLDPDLKAAAEKVVELTGIDATNEHELAAQEEELRTGSIVQQQVDRNPEMKAAREKDPAQWALVMKRFGERQADALDEVRKPVQQEFHDRLVRAYATHFTVDELNAIATFYQSPAGEKLVTVVPPMMTENMGWLQDTIGERMQPKIQALAGDFRQAVTPLMTGSAPKSDVR